MARMSTLKGIVLLGLFSTLVVVAVVIASPSSAKTVLPIALTPSAHLHSDSPMTRLVLGSDVALRGTVIDSTASWDADHRTIHTTQRVAVQHWVMGASTAELAADEIAVISEGGLLPDEGLGLSVSHSPSLTPGEDVLLFLRKRADGYEIALGEHGKVTIRGEHASIYGAAPVETRALMTVLVATAQAAGRVVSLPEDWRLHAPPISSAAITIEQGFVHGNCKWDVTRVAGNQAKDLVNYRVNNNSTHADQGRGSSADFLNAIIRAGETWGLAPEANFNLVYTGVTTATNTGYNGSNEIMFVSNPSFITAGKSEIWFTLARDPNDPDQQICVKIIEADVRLNDQIAWVATGDPDPFQVEIDLQSIVLHEFGHWLELLHDSDNRAVMYFQLDAGVLKRDLFQSDIDGITFFYPCRTQPCLPPPTVTPPVTPAPPTPVPPTPVPPTPTPEIFVAEIDPVEGGELVGDDGLGRAVTISVPPGAVQQPTILRMEWRQAVQATGGEPGRVLWTMHFTAQQNGALVESLTFTPPVTITLTYLVADVTEHEEQHLGLFWEREALVTAECNQTTLNSQLDIFTSSLCDLQKSAMFGVSTEAYGYGVYLPLVVRE